jgi:predicted nucleic acid-binding protein
MTFLDSSTIIEYLRDNQSVIDYLDEREPWWTSTICVFEVLIVIIVSHCRWFADPFRRTTGKQLQ